MDPSIPPKRRGAPKKKLSDAESAALMMSHAALTMAASHGSLPGGSPVRAMSQVLLLLADGDGEGALARLAEHVRRDGRTTRYVVRSAHGYYLAKADPDMLREAGITFIDAASCSVWVPDSAKATPYTSASAAEAAIAGFDDVLRVGMSVVTFEEA